MKKITLLVVLLSIFVSFGCFKKRDATVREGIINGVVGNVIITKNKKSVQAKVGDIVVVGMTLETKAKSIVHVRFGENMIRLSENTILVVEQLDASITANNEQTSFKLRVGEVFSIVGRRLTAGDFYQVRTNTTIVGVRGTEFVVSTWGEMSKISCITGKVDVTSTALEDAPEFLEVEANEEVVIIEQQPSTVTAISEEDIKHFETIFEEMRRLLFGFEEKPEKAADVEITEIEEQVVQEQRIVRRAQPPVEEAVEEDADSANVRTRPDIKKLSIDAAKVKEMD